MADTENREQSVSRSALEARYRDILKQVPWTSPIYLPTERIALADKVAGMSRVAEIHNRRLDRIYRPQLRALRQLYSSTRRCFIIGNGPSLNDTDLSRLKGEVTFAVNGFYLKAEELDWKPTFYVVEDHLVAEDRAVDLNRLHGTTKLFPAYLGYCLDEDEDTIFFNHRARVSYPHGFDFSTDAEKVTYTGCTVTFTCMQIAAYLGFREIYLIGVDADYTIPDDSEIDTSAGTGVIDMQSDDPNHFDPNYFGKGYRWHDPQVDMMIEAYKEAELVTRANGQVIYNATKGGKLEVFQRRDYDSLFASSGARGRAPAAATPVAPPEEAGWGNAATHDSPFPRVLVIDMVPIGGTAATGAIKHSLFAGWPWARLMEVYAESGGPLVVDGGVVGEKRVPPSFQDHDALIELCKAYDPDVILYRPLDDRDDLHDFAMKAIEAIDAPVITWVMDDWLARLKRKSRSRHKRYFEDMKRLVARAHTNFAISSPMQFEMERRLGGAFSVLANGIDVATWTSIQGHVPGTRPGLLLRYAGGLAHDMCRKSVIALAEAVEALAQTRDIRLEINTHSHWLSDAQADFAAFRATSLTATEYGEEDYFRWLSEADILVVAYNFDDTSGAYVRYSMANKIPEVLASGRAVLAIGDLDYASIAHLHRSGAAMIVSEAGAEPISRALRTLDQGRWRLADLGAAARQFAFERHDIALERARLSSAIRSAARTRKAPVLPRNYRRIAEILEAARNIDLGNNHDRYGSVIQRNRSDLPMANSGKPTNRLSRMLGFYASWRGLLALLAVALAALPGLFSVSALGMTGLLLSVLPAGGLALCLAMIAYLHTVIIDHHNLIDYRIRRVERAERSAGRRRS